MTSTKEKLFHFILIILFFSSSFYILNSTDYKILIFVPLALIILVMYWLKRNKKITKFVNDDFEKLGFEILSERPLNKSESNIDVKVTPLNSGSMPITKTKNSFKRIFKVRNKENQILEINTDVIEQKNGEIIIQINKKRTIANKV